jgi:hypothetical protein
MKQQKSLLKKLLLSLRDSLIIQTAMVLAVLPFLACWGLPLSLMSIVGNIIHSVFLTAFLMVSSLLFFATLLGLPVGPLVWVLTQIHTVWHWLLSCSSPCWLVTVTPALMLVIMGCVALAATWYSHAQRRWLFFLAVILWSSSLYLAHQPYQPTVIRRNGKAASCVPQPNGSLHIYDHNLIARTVDTQRLVTYVLLPHLRKEYGLPKTKVYGSGRRVAYAQRVLNELS